MRTAIALAVLLCLTTSADAGSTYRWVDKDGNVHYGDQVPMGTPAKLVKPDVVLPSSSPTEAEEAAAKAKAEECKKLQDQLASYASASRITEMDALGNVREYTEDGKKKLIEQTKSKMEETCGKAAAVATP